MPTVIAARPEAVAAAEPADEPAGRLVGVGRQQHLAAERRVALGHVRVEQAVQLGDVRLAEDDRAGRLQLGDDRRVVLRRRVLQRDRAAGGRQARRVDRVVEQHRDAVQRPARRPSSRAPCRAPSPPRSRPVDRAHGLRRRALGVGQRDPREVRLGQRLGRQRAGGHAAPAGSCTDSVSSENGSDRRASPTSGHERVVVRVAAAALGVRRRGHRLGAAVHARVHLLAGWRSLVACSITYADADQVALGVRVPWTEHVQRAPRRRVVAHRDRDLRVAARAGWASRAATRAEDRDEVVARVVGRRRCSIMSSMALCHGDLARSGRSARYGVSFAARPG